MVLLMFSIYSGSSSFMLEVTVNFVYILAGVVTSENLSLTQISNSITIYDIILQNIFYIIFGIIAIITSFLTLRYKKIALKYKEKEHRFQVERTIEDGHNVAIFLTRESMVNYLLNMYKKVNEGDIIWGQCIGCSSYTQEVRSRILEAAGRGVRFKIIINSLSTNVKDFRALYDPLQNAELVESKENTFRIQGLSNQEVVIAFPGVDSYTSVLIKNPHFVEIVKNWFDSRFEELR